MDEERRRSGDAGPACPRGTERAGPLWRRLLENSFAIDTRTLALLRVGAALLILLDLGMRLPHLHALHAGSGAYGLAAMVETVGPASARLSVYYWAAPFPILVAVLFALAALFALGMLVGYRTRLFTALSWYMLTALHLRNPEALGGGDALFRLMLLWSIFLPLGARWSVDAGVSTSADRGRRRVLSVASAGLLLQIAFMYWFSVLMKFGPSWWSGEALHRALQMDFLVHAPGVWLRGEHELTRWMTHATLVLEVLGPLLALSPVWTGRIRLVVIPMFLAFHAGISATMMVGFFPFATALAWLAFLPGGFWDRLLAWMDTPRRRAATVYYDGDCGFCKRMIGLLRAMLLHPATPCRPAQSSPEIERRMREHNSWVLVDHTGTHRYHYDAFVRLCRLSPLWPLAFPLAAALRPIGGPAYRWIARNRDRASAIAFFLAPRPVPLTPRAPSQAAAGLLLAFVFVQNLGESGAAYEDYLERDPALVSRVPPEWIYRLGAAIRPPRRMLEYAGLLMLNQRWTLFAPEPRAADMWYVWAGLMENGGRVDLWRMREGVDFQEPTLEERDIPSMRWHVFLAHPPDAQAPGGTFRIRNMLAWAVGRWNTEHEGPERVVRADLFLVVEPTGTDNPEPPRRILLGSHQQP